MAKISVHSVFQRFLNLRLVHPAKRPITRRMTRTLATVGALAAMLLLSACFEMTSVVTVNKNGTAVIEETALLGAQLKAMMGSLGDQAGGPPGQPSLKDLVPDKAKAEERAKKLGQGVTVKSHEAVKMPDGREGVKVTYAVADVNKLQYKPFEAKQQDGTESKPMTFALSGGTVSVSMPPDKPKNKPAAEKPKVPAEQMQAQMAMMKPMFAGMRMAVQIKGAGGIASSDATHLNGDTVTIMDIQFDKIMEKPDIFTKFMESADDKEMTPAQAAEKFKGVDGIKVEGKEKISIKLK